MFKIYDCDFGVKVNGVSYDFDHVAELQVEDPERNRVTRGANASNKVGISYKEGMTQPKRWTIPIMAMSTELKGVLDGCYDDQTRLDCYCIDRKTGSKKFLSNAIMSNKPQQLAVSEAAESLQVSLEFEGFDNSETLK